MTVFIVEEIHLGWSYASRCQISVQEKNVLTHFSADVHIKSTGTRARGDFPEGQSLVELDRLEVLCPGWPSPAGTMLSSYL